MAGDITRSTFDPKKGYTSVRMQQGRLQLDADWNEQADIQNHLRRAYVTDMIGSGSGASKVDPITGKPSDTNFQMQLISTQPLPSGQGQDSGTATDSTAAASGTTPDTSTTTEPNSVTATAPGSNSSGIQSQAKKEPPITDLVLLPGHFYINGILCESTPGSLFTVKGGAANTLQVVDSLTIDGQRLSKGDWLIRDESPSLVDPQPAAGDKTAYQEGWRIRDIDVKTRILTVDGPVFRDGESLTLRRVITYTTQPDFLEAPPLAKGTYLAYLDVWERHLSAFDDPTLREVALNVTDTTTRTKTVWQVKLQPLASATGKGSEVAVGSTPLVSSSAWSPESVSQQWAEFQQRTQFRGKDPQGKDYRDLAPQLNACARLCPGTSTNGITANRLGNFLYRVEVHQGNDSDADPFEKRSTVTFKWSRTNGSVVSPIKKIEGDVIRIAKASQDVWADSQPGQWLELLTLAQELNGESGILVPLVRVSDTKIEFDPARIIGGAILDKVTKVRRWDHSVDKAPQGAIPIPVNKVSQGAIPIQSEWIELESGIKVQFYPNRTYRTGDYWLIPSRTATNDIEWPSDRADEDVTLADNQGASVSQPLPQPPNGIEHQYALLAIVEVADGKDKDQKQITQVTDQRVLFPPLQRTLDTAGGTITGNLTIKKELTGQGNLTVDGTTTTRDLKVTNQFAAETFRGKSFVIASLPLDDDTPTSGTITHGGEGDDQYIAFRAAAGNYFAFLDGNVRIGGTDTSSSYGLDVNGIINGTDIFQNGEALALQSNLITHTDDQNNPHRVTATQIDNQGGANQIVTQINNGSGTINTDRVANLTSHINDFNNPHRVNATQIDTLGGSSQIVARINAGSGVINSTRVADLDDHINNIDNPHKVKAEQIVDLDSDFIFDKINSGSGTISPERIHEDIARTNAITAELIQNLLIRGGYINSLLSTRQLSVGTSSIPDNLSPQLYVKGDLYVDNDDSNGGKIFAKAVAATRIASEDIATTSVKSQNFTQLSSGALKDEITELSRQEVAEALGKLNPVRFVFRDDAAHVPRAGFIAEDVPDLLATPDHQSIKIMDLVAVLTKAVQDNRKVINQLSKQVSQQTEEINQLKQAIHNARSPSP